LKVELLTYIIVTGQQGVVYRHIILLALSLKFPKK